LFIYVFNITRVWPRKLWRTDFVKHFSMDYMLANLLQEPKLKSTLRYVDLNDEQNHSQDLCGKVHIESRS